MVVLNFAGECYVTYVNYIQLYSVDKDLCICHYLKNISQVCSKIVVNAR